MFSAINEISKLRKGLPYRTAECKGSPYCLEVTEINGEKTVYCFGVPIVDHAGQPVRRQFTPSGDGKKLYFYGSGGKITVGDGETDGIIFENNLGQCRLTLPRLAPLGTDGSLSDAQLSLRPTYSGIHATVACQAGEAYRCSFRHRVLHPSVWCNGKSLTVFANEKPYAVFSCIGAGDAEGNILSPAEMKVTEAGTDTFEITLSHTERRAAFLLFSLNLQCNKFLWDSAVESKDITGKHLYDDTAFPGYTRRYGKMWLYAKPNLACYEHLAGRRFSRAILHLPVLGGRETPLTMYRIRRSFCTLQLCWGSRLPAWTELPLLSRDRDRYHFDITDTVTDPHSGVLCLSDGWLVRAAPNSKGFCAVATGDNYDTPPIMELRFSESEK